MPKPRLRPGHARTDSRRTLIDDRTGIVVDISQSGPDDEPGLYIELYAWASGGRIDVHRLEGLPHPAIVLTRSLLPISTEDAEVEAALVTFGHLAPRG